MELNGPKKFVVYIYKKVGALVGYLSIPKKFVFYIYKKVICKHILYYYTRLKR